MQNADAMIASQKGSWKFPETEALMFAPIMRSDGRFRFVEPTNGTLTLNNAAIDVKIKRPETKNIRENSGFL